MFKRMFFMLLVVGLLFGAIAYWKQQQMQANAARMSQPPPPATVATTEVQVETWQPRLATVGSLMAVQGISVTTEVAGTVREILFQSGHATQEGEVLVKLDDSVDQAELKGLLATRELAALKYHRLSRLLSDKSISQADVDEAKAQLESTEAQVASKRAVIAKKTIRSPFSGLLGIRQADIGEYLAPGAKIVPLESLNPIHVDFSLPERQFSSLKLNQAMLVRVAAYPGREFQGKISAINPGIDIATRNLQLRATLDNPERLLRPGMFADVEVLLPVQDKVLTIPRLAITYNPYGDSVFVIEEKDGKTLAQRRQISTGGVQKGRVEVLKGLEAGTRVVLAGQVKLRNGQAVRIDNSVVPQEGAVFATTGK